MEDLQTPKAESATKSPLIFTIRILLAAMSAVGFLGWSYITLVVLAYAGRAAFFGPAGLLLLFGYSYLLFSLFFSVKNPSLKTLTAIGIGLNLPLVLASVYAVTHFEDKLNWSAFLPAAFVLVWFLLGLARWFTETGVSALKQIISIGLILLGILSALAAIRPLTVDPESEARRLSEAGGRVTTPDQAKQLFAEALDQARRIDNPHHRDHPLAVIAYNQAKAGLISDAEKTANECQADVGRPMAFNSIVRGQVEFGDLHGALLTAKTHDSGDVLFMALKEASIENAQAGRSDRATAIMRFAEQAADDSAFENLRRWSFSAVAMAQAQLGLHDEAISSARKTGAEYAPEQMAFVAMTEKKAGHLEHSRASIEEAIRGVKAVRNDQVSRDSTFYEIADHLAEAGMFDEARSVTDSIESATTRDIFLQSMEYKRARQQR